LPPSFLKTSLAVSVTVIVYAHDPFPSRVRVCAIADLRLLVIAMIQTPLRTVVIRDTPARAYLPCAR